MGGILQQVGLPRVREADGQGCNGLQQRCRVHMDDRDVILGIVSGGTTGLYEAFCLCIVWMLDYARNIQYDFSFTKLFRFGKSDLYFKSLR